MKIRMRISKDGASLYERVYDVFDAESFGKACADAWCALEEQQMEKEDSIGAVMEHLKRDMLDQMMGANITLEQL